MVVIHEKCYICGETTNFCIADDASLLREATCSNCRASIRNSDTAKLIVTVLLGSAVSISECMEELQNFKILECSASGVIHDLLKNLKGYVCFEYFDDVPIGQMKSGILCDDLEKLTFDDESFDLIISQDVIEHIVDKDKAFSEINRVLKHKGYHIFTVPLHEGRITKSRKST